jgi:hypothetical protein
MCSSTSTMPLTRIAVCADCNSSDVYSVEFRTDNAMPRLINTMNPGQKELPEDEVPYRLSGYYCADCQSLVSIKFVPSISLSAVYKCHPSLGSCPKCGSPVYHNPDGHYECSRYYYGCEFRINAQIASVNIPENQIIKLLSAGKTDLIKGFVAQRRKEWQYNAYLYLDGEGNLKFEYPPRDNINGE